MNKLSIFLGIILVLFLICGIEGCTPVCNAPYMVVGMGCCLDQNNNSICDNDEQTENITTSPVVKGQITNLFSEIAKIPYNYSDQKVTLDGVLDLCPSAFSGRNTMVCIRGTNEGGSKIYIDITYNPENITEEIAFFSHFLNQSVTVTGYLYKGDQSYWTYKKGYYIEITDMTKLSLSQLYSDLIDKCTKSFNECKEISEIKYDLSISIIKIERFEEMSKAEVFFNTWRGLLQTDIKTNLAIFDYKTPLEDYFPIVLIASKMRGPEGQLPIVLICTNNGQLTRYSKMSVLCGA